MQKEKSTEEEQPLLGERGLLSMDDPVQKKMDNQRSSRGMKLKIETHYKPKPITALSPRKLVVVVCILATELCERLSYYSVVANLVLFCTSTLDYSSNDAATISLVFSGTTYLMPIIGGYIADAHSGRFNAIYGSALIYLVGLFLLPCSAINYKEFFNDDKYVLDLNWRRAFYLLGLVLVSFGTGGIKANVGPFGAQQIEDGGPKIVQTFFNWYYWFVNAGGLIAYSGVAAVQQNIGFTLGFFIPVLSMLLAIFFFLIARKNYCHRDFKGSLMVDSFIVCWQGCRKSSKEQGAKGFFDTAREKYGGSYSNDIVDGVISVVRLLPIFFFVIMYWTIYSQMQSTFFIQGERMDLSIGSAQIPVAMLNAFNTVALIVLIPILDRGIYPCFQRMGRPLRHLHRIGIGFVLAALSMIAAAVVEIERKKLLGFDQKVGDETFFAANISVFLQVPQFALVGCSEGFASISGLEFAYTQSPSSMQGVMMGVFLATNGLGSYLATAILRIVELATKDDPWFPNEINDGHAEYLFYLLSALMGVFFLGYLVAAKLYKYRNFEEQLIVEKEQSSDENAQQRRQMDNDSVSHV